MIAFWNIFVEGDKSKYRSVFKWLKFISCNPCNSNSQISHEQPQFTNQTDTLSNNYLLAQLFLLAKSLKFFNSNEWMTQEISESIITPVHNFFPTNS